MSDKITLEFGPWEPDAALLAGQQASKALNVIPTKRGYRYFPAAETGRYPALADPVLDMFAIKDMDGSMLTAAATGSGIYLLEYTQLTGWDWVERHSEVPLNSNRAFAWYGDELFALYGTQLIKQASRGTNFTDVVNAPSASVLGVIRDFLVLGCLSSNQAAIQWSGIDRPDDWPTPGTDQAQYIQSDIQVFPVGGKVQSVVGAVGGVDGLIFLERAIQRATYVGTPYIFQFDFVDQQQGTIAPRSPIVCGTRCFFLSEDGWKATDGAGVTYIGSERVDRWFFDTCEPTRIEEVRGVHDFQHRLAVWSFPSDKAPVGIHDTLLVYNYALDRWSCASVNIECLYQDYARGLVLEELDAYGDLDELEDNNVSSLDSTAFKNGLRVLGCVDASHKMGSFTGNAMEAVIDTAEQGGERMMLHGLRPLVNRGADLKRENATQAMPLWRILQIDDRREGKYTSQQRDGVCYQHVSANYFSARVKIPAGVPWIHAVGVEALVEKEGGM